MQPLTPVIGRRAINAAGEVIGINSLKISQSGVEGLGFAIPSNEVVPLIEEMTEHGHVERPYIGVGLRISTKFRTICTTSSKSVEGGVMVGASTRISCGKSWN